MLIAITYNTKKEAAPRNPLREQVSAVSSINVTNENKFINDNLVKNYPERIDDTYAEWDSIETIDAIKNAIVSSGNEAYLIEADEDAYIKLKEIKPDFVFNVAEGFYGVSRESQIPSMLEMLNIPFTGSDSISTGICHDKSRCKEILSYYGIPTPGFFITDKIIKNKDNLTFPKFVKPLHEGSSKGIYNSSVVNNLKELNREISRIKNKYNQKALVEDFLEGREFTIAMLGNGDNLKILPIIEINLEQVPEGFNKVYSYEVKWFFDTRESMLEIFTCPAQINTVLKNKIEEICVKTFYVLRLRDWARIDIRLDGNNIPNVIEINPLPGILPDPRDNSCFPKSARVAGMDYNAMINAVLEASIKRVKKEKE